MMTNGSLEGGLALRTGDLNFYREALIAMDSQKHGFLLVGHSTRKAAGAEQLREVYAQFREILAQENPEAHATSFGFLELAEPTIEEAVHDLARQGATHVSTVPLLLFTAGHAEEDIPTAVTDAAAKHGLQLASQTPSLGCMPSILKLSATRFHEAACRRPESFAALQGVVQDRPVVTCGATSCSGVFCSQTALVLVGRGSSSASATGEMRRFAELRRNLTPCRWMQTAFIHAQQPDFLTALHAAAHSGCANVVVQPHLLFEGLLIDELREQVEQFRRKNPDQHWVITETLGVDRALAVALAELSLAEPSS